MNKSIVLELQEEVLSTKCDILNALRKAHVIASKLKLQEFDSWVQNELQGYKNYSEIPEYRTVRGEIKGLNPYHGWIPVMLPDSMWEDTLCSRKLSESISALMELYDKSTTGYFQISFPPEILSSLNKMTDAPINMKFVVMVGIHKLKEICEKVKDTLLQWTISLEEAGIQGEHLSFTKEEKLAAQNIPQTINNYYGSTNIINAPTNNSVITAGNNNSINFNYQEAQSALKEINHSIEKEKLSSDDKDTAIELLADINQKISDKKKPSIIKSALIGLKDFLVGVGASITAALIQSKFPGFFS